MTRRGSALACTITLAACHTSPAAVDPHPGDGVRIARAAELAARSTSRAPLELPFGQDQNGTELVIALLHRARELGALYVGDLTFHMVFKRRGTVVECETKVLFSGDPALAPQAVAPAAPTAPDADSYSTEVTNFEPHEVSYVATEREPHCARSDTEVVDLEPRYASPYDVEIKDHPIDVMPTEHVVRGVRTEACAPARVTHRVTRYDFEARVGYVPPDWQYIASSYAVEPLFESAPLCYAIDANALGPHPTHRLSATLGFRGWVEQRETMAERRNH